MARRFFCDGCDADITGGDCHSYVIRLVQPRAIGGEDLLQSKELHLCRSCNSSMHRREGEFDFPRPWALLWMALLTRPNTDGMPAPEVRP